MKKTNVVFFDDLNKVVKLIPLDYFKGRIEIPDKRKKAKAADKKTDFYSIGRNFELGIGCVQNFRKAFDSYMGGACSGNPDCCLKVAIYYLYGYGIGFTSRALFELYLDESIYLGSKEALIYKRMWAGISADKYFDGGFAYPVQCIV